MGRAQSRPRPTEERKGRCCFRYFAPAALLTTELPPANALSLGVFYTEDPAIIPSAAPLRSGSLSPPLRSTAYGGGGDASARGRTAAGCSSSATLYPSYSMMSIALPVTVVGLAAMIALLFVGMGVLIYCYLRILSGAPGAVVALHPESHGGEGRSATPQYSGNTNLNVPKPDDVGGVGNCDDGAAKLVVIMAGNDIPSFIAFSTPLQHLHQEQTPG